MKPRPRIRKTIKWGGAVMSVWLAGVWLISLPARKHGVWFARASPGSAWAFLQAIPFWTPAALAFAITAIAWRLDTLATRLARLNLCPTCRYDRTGLAAGAVCPECGGGVIGMV